MKKTTFREAVIELKAAIYKLIEIKWFIKFVERLNTLLIKNNSKRSSNMNEELKPCAHCGHTPILQKLGSGWYRIQCSCSANVGDRMDKENLIKAWNTRKKTKATLELEGLLKLNIENANNMVIELSYKNLVIKALNKTVRVKHEEITTLKAKVNKGLIETTKQVAGLCGCVSSFLQIIDLYKAGTLYFKKDFVDRCNKALERNGLNILTKATGDQP